MPHIHVKIIGKNEQEKATLAEAISKAVVDATQSSPDTISVTIEDINKEDWAEKVYRPDILNHQDWLYKKPGYDPL